MQLCLYVDPLLARSLLTQNIPQYKFKYYFFKMSYRTTKQTIKLATKDVTELKHGDTAPFTPMIRIPLQINYNEAV